LPRANLVAPWVNLQRWDVFCMPVYLSDHFMLAVFYPPFETVYVYDSLGSGGTEAFKTIKTAVRK
jgi:hypothetical protein